jgi:hypothetical protein
MLLHARSGTRPGGFGGCPARPGPSEAQSRAAFWQTAVFPEAAGGSTAQGSDGCVAAGSAFDLVETCFGKKAATMFPAAAGINPEAEWWWLAHEMAAMLNTHVVGNPNHASSGACHLYLRKSGGISQQDSPTESCILTVVFGPARPARSPTVHSARKAGSGDADRLQRLVASLGWAQGTKGWEGPWIPPRSVAKRPRDYQRSESTDRRTDRQRETEDSGPAISTDPV